MPPSSAERHIPTLDGWRAIAILTVVLCHGVPEGSALWPLRIFGVHGVYIFFGISGFLITSKLLEEEARRGGIDLKAFYLRRAFRILPPALFFITVLALLGAVGVLAKMPLKEWLVDAFFLQNYVGAFEGRTAYTFHFWSLAVEEHFYLLFPFLLAAAGSKRLRFIIPLLCVAAAAWRIIDDQFVHLTAAFPGIKPDYRTDRIFDLLLYGCGLAVLIHDPKWRERVTRWVSPAVVYVTAVVFALVVWKQPPFAITIEGLCVTVMLAGTVLRPTSLAGRALELEPMKFVGRISYSTYLWQQIFFVASFRQPELLQRFPLNLVLTLACAYGSYRLIEQPLIKVGRRVVGARKQPSAAPVPARVVV